MKFINAHSIHKIYLTESIDKVITRYFFVHGPCFNLRINRQYFRRRTKLTLPPEMFGVFGSVWCKMAQGEVGVSLPMPRPHPPSFRLTETFFKSHNSFIMTRHLKSKLNSKIPLGKIAEI